MENWPNFFIVGTPKAGTTSLYEYLKNILGIYMSPIKEPHYFSRSTVSDNNHILNPIRDKNEYLHLYENVKNEKIIGEASTTYLADPLAPKLIYEKVPNARIVISLRDPVERVYSQYLMNIRDNRLKLSFHEELQKELKSNKDYGYEIQSVRLKASFYYEDVKRYLDLFGSKQVKIIIFEEFIKNPIDTINEILSFCDLGYTIDELKAKAYNPSAVPRGSIAKFLLFNKKVEKIAKKVIPKSSRKVLRKKVLTTTAKPEMEKADKDFLVNLYRNDIKKLKILIGRNLPWPNF